MSSGRRPCRAAPGGDSGGPGAEQRPGGARAGSQGPEDRVSGGATQRGVEAAEPVTRTDNRLETFGGAELRRGRLQ